MSALKTTLAFAAGTVCGVILANNCNLENFKKAREKCPLKTKQQQMEEAKDQVTTTVWKTK